MPCGAANPLLAASMASVYAGNISGSEATISLPPPRRPRIAIRLEIV